MYRNGLLIVKKGHNSAFNLNLVSELARITVLFQLEPPGLAEPCSGTLLQGAQGGAHSVAVLCASVRERVRIGEQGEAAIRVPAQLRPLPRLIAHDDDGGEAWGAAVPKGAGGRWRKSR